MSMMPTCPILRFGMAKPEASDPWFSGKMVMENKVAMLILSRIWKNCVKLNGCVRHVSILETNWVITAFAICDRKQNCLMDLFTVYCGFLNFTANCIMVQLHPLGIIAASLGTRQPAPFWRNSWDVGGQAQQDEQGKQRLQGWNREVVGIIRDVSAPETVSSSPLRWQKEWDFPGWSAQPFCRAQCKT